MRGTSLVISMSSSAFETCSDCGIRLRISSGPRHPYLGASASCWALYGEVLTHEWEVFHYPPCHRMLVDAYAVQHPGVPGPQAKRSVIGHLMSLCLLLEHGFPPKQATQTLARIVLWLKSQETLPWLPPPASLGKITVADLPGAIDLTEHTRRVEEWGKSVFEAWHPYHKQIRIWTGSILGGKS